MFEDQIGVVVADAVGKGIPAALLMAFLRASLRTSVQIGYAPHIALAKVGNLLWDSVESNQFITAIYGILDATNRTFVFSNAGHNPPLLIKPNGEYRFVEYTESANANGEEYGQERFAKRVLEGIDLPANELIDFIRKGVADFTERKFLDDDGTLFIVKAI